MSGAGSRLGRSQGNIVTRVLRGGWSDQGCCLAARGRLEARPLLLPGRVGELLADRQLTCYFLYL